MNKLNNSVFSVILLILLSIDYSYAQPNNYRLIWSDEFKKNGMPDISVWNFEKGFVRNHEAQWYQQENAFCKNGKLIIEVKRVHTKNPNYRQGSKDWRTSREYIDYTSASLNTMSHKSWLYGRFEMRAKIDTAAGLWPAFWTLGINKPWPSNGEIDIMEYYQKNILANIACGTDKSYHAKWFSNKKAIASFKDKNWSNKFHIWRMDWDPKEIKLYVDDFLMNDVPLDSLRNADGSNPFTQPQYILLNLAIGGDNGGRPDSTVFPRRYEIDYVRVYQKSSN